MTNGLYCKIVSTLENVLDHEIEHHPRINGVVVHKKSCNFALLDRLKEKVN